MQNSAALRWSTDGISEQERFDYWRDSICAAFDPMSPELTRPERRRFHGDISAWQLGDAALMEIRASAHQTSRSPQDIARGSRDNVFLYKQQAKAWFGFDDQDDFITTRGMLVVGDADRPFVTAPTGRSAFHHCVLKLPRKMLEPAFARPRDIRTCVVSAPNGMGALLAAYFDAFVVEAPHLPPAEQNVALQTLVSLTAVAYGHVASHHDPRQAVRTAQLQAAKQVIERHLHRPDLTPDTVARLVGISVRHLHRLFEPSGTTLHRHIVARRLESARGRLGRRDHLHETVVSIALDCGFESLATFYRGFRQAYGIAPKDYRLRAANKSAAERRIPAFDRQGSRIDPAAQFSRWLARSDKNPGTV